MCFVIFLPAPTHPRFSSPHHPPTCVLSKKQYKSNTQNYKQKRKKITKLNKSHHRNLLQWMGIKQRPING